MAHSVKPVDAGVSVDQVLQGKYRVDAILGHGGMGVVAKCTHLALNEAVAIKMLRQDVLTDQDAVSRFIREAQAAVKLKSEYVARVSDVGTFDNGVPFMVMEYLEGHDLGQLLIERGVLPVQWAVELMLQTAEALAEAHSLGIVHRDIKPTNLFVTWRPDNTALIKVLDFGISKSPMGTDMHLTQTQSLLGTPAYMSPEQMRSARLVDTRTDIWSLGTVFYEILEGRRPFEAESFSEMCVKVAVDPPAPMHNTPPPLQQVILRCLAKSPEQRYSSMAEFARDLIPFAADPHGAHMLVERMVRMLRRSQYDWDGNSATGARRDGVPGAVRDISSGAVRSGSAPSQWGLGSDPAGSPWNERSSPALSPWNEKSSPAASPWNEKSNPAAAPWHGPTPIPGSPIPATPMPGSLPMRGDPSNPFVNRDPSQPFVRPLSDEIAAASPTVSRPRKKGLAFILVALALATAGAVAYGVVQGTGTETSASQTPPVETPSPASGPQPAQAAGPTGSADPSGNGSGGSEAGSAATTAGGSSSAGSADTTTGDAAGAGSNAGAAQTQTTSDGDRTGGKTAGKTGGKTGGKTIRTSGKTGAGSSRTGDKTTDKTADKTAGKTGDKTTDKTGDKATDKTGDKAEKPPQKCDPFASMHACKKD